MATSGNSNFTVTRDAIIQSALRTLGVLGAGATPLTEDYTNCSEALNIMIKAWVVKGFPLWCYQQVIMQQVEGLIVYPMGPNSGYIASVSSTGGTGYTAGTWTAVGGTTGTDASGTYTVTSGKPSVFTVLVAGTSYTSAPTSFTLSGAGTGATITGLVAGATISRPLRIISAFIRTSDNNDRTLIPLSRDEYDTLGSKNQVSATNSYYYDCQLDTGYLNVYSPSSDSTSYLYALAHRTFQDMDVGTDTFDFPQEWFLALKWGLSSELAEEYGIEAEKISRLEQKALYYLQEVSDFSVEEASIFFTMSARH